MLRTSVQAFEWRNVKLVNNFSHESDVKSLQDLFTSRPENTPLYFIIAFRVKYEEVSSFHPCMLRVFFSQPSSVCLAVLAMLIQLRPYLQWAHACPLFNSAHASVTTNLPGRETLFYALLGARPLFQETFSPVLFQSRETVSHLSYHAFLLRKYGRCSSSGCFCIFSLLANILI